MNHEMITAPSFGSRLGNAESAGGKGELALWILGFECGSYIAEAAAEFADSGMPISHENDGSAFQRHGEHRGFLGESALGVPLKDDRGKGKFGTGPGACLVWRRENEIRRLERKCAKHGKVIFDGVAGGKVGLALKILAVDNPVALI